MEQLRGDSIEFRFPRQVENLLEDLSFSLDDNGKIGLIGDNGCGKTTLLALMRGRLKPSSGMITTRKNISIGYLPQEVSFDETTTVSDYLWQANQEFFRLKQALDGCDQSSLEYADLISDYYAKGVDAFEARIKKILAGFNIADNILNVAISNLSGGEKTKIALARILTLQPNVMLLDEPTNHLEIASLAWLESYLTESTIPYLIVSHDRRFLDNCVDKIWELIDKSLNVYSGNYSFYKKTKETEKKRQQREYDDQQKKIRKLRSAALQRRKDSQKMENFKYRRSVSKSGSIQKRDEGSGKRAEDDRKRAGRKAAPWQSP
jgi:ATPase subunit of ABC transporter with duplicated ATPase domains